MKRTRFDSEYDKVRAQAGLDRPKYDFDSLDRPTAAAETAARVAASNEDFRKRMDDLAKAESRLDAEKRAAFDAWRREYNIRVIKREYTDLGLTPPTPLVSLTLLRQIGWTVEPGINGKHMLISPLHMPRPTPSQPRPSEFGS